MRPRTVLFFAYECAPHQSPRALVAGQRPAQLAKYLGRHGWKAVVICSDFRSRGTASKLEEVGIDMLVDRAVDEIRSADTVLIPTPSLAYDGWLDRSWRISGKWAKDHRSGVPLRKALTVAKLVTGDYSQAWQPVARAVAWRLAQRHPIGVAVGEHSPDAGLFLARSFSRRLQSPWIADFRDPILQPLRPVARVLYAPVARGLVRSASATVAVNPAWATTDERLLRRPSHSIPNGFDPEEFEGERPSDGAGLTVAYLGSIIGEQDPALFLKGVAEAAPVLRQQPAGTRFRFLYRGHADALIERIAAGLGISDLVDHGPPVPREQAIAMMRSAHLLLLLSISPERNRDPFFQRGYYPAKTFDYFGARRPILCVPGDDGLLADLVRTSCTGTVAATPAAVAGILSDSMKRRAEGRALPYHPDEQVVSRFDRRELAGRFAHLLDEVAAAAVPTV